MRSRQKRDRRLGDTNVAHLVPEYSLPPLLRSAGLRRLRRGGKLPSWVILIMSIRSTNRQRYPVPLQHVVELWRRITPQGTAPDRRKSNPSNRAQFRSRVHVLYSLAWGRQLGNTCTYLTTRASPVDIITHSLTHSLHHSHSLQWPIPPKMATTPSASPSI